MYLCINQYLGIQTGMQVCNHQWRKIQIFELDDSNHITLLISKETANFNYNSNYPQNTYFTWEMDQSE